MINFNFNYTVLFFFSDGVTSFFIICVCALSLFFKKIEILFVYLIEYSEREPKMNRKQQEQQLFNRTAELLADDKITPEQACSFIETLRDAGIISDDTMEPEPEEQQKGFNEIAMVFADWKITREEACEAFNEWIDEWKTKK